MPSLRRRTSFITRPIPTTVSQALTEVDKARSVSTPTWRSSRQRHLRVLYENDAELTDHSASIIFYTFEKVIKRP